MSFYRTYRPQVIDEMDNVYVREQLSALLSKKREQLPHAYLFTGPKGTGKTTAARLIAKLFNCENSTKHGPCGACEACRSIAEGHDIDVLEIDAASNRGIDEIRELRATIALAPVHSAYKIYIIDEVHMLTTEAFNALLKTLEEPPLHAVFVLATTDPQKLPATIISRCLHLSFGKAQNDELVHVLSRIAKKEKLSIDDEALDVIATLADGSFRDATKLLEQISFISGKISADMVRKTLARSDESFRKQFIAQIVAQDRNALFASIATLDHEGREIKSFVIDVLRDLELQLVDVATGSSKAGWTIPNLTRVIQVLTVCFQELKFSPITRLPLELAVIELTTGEAPERIQQTVPAPEPAKPKESPAQPVTAEVKTISASAPVQQTPQSLGLLTFEKLVEHWADVIAATKPHNHSIAGVLRSSRPKEVAGGIVTIEAFYKFHQEKLSTMQVRQMLGDLLKKLFGETVKVEVVLGTK